MVLLLRRPHWRLLAVDASVDGGGTCRWMCVKTGGSGNAVDHVGRGWRRVVMAIEFDGVDGGGGKGVVEMELRVEETALAVFDGGCRWLQLMAEGLEATALAVWVGERGRKRERRWTLLGVVVVAGRGDDDARRRL